MAIESIVALILATAFLAGLAIYADRHRAEDQHRRKPRNLAQALQEMPPGDPLFDDYQGALKAFDVVATLRDFPERRVEKGQVGTVVEELDDDHVLVEFADLKGVAYAIVPVPLGELIQLKYTPAVAAQRDQHG